MKDERLLAFYVDAVGQPVADLPLHMRGAPSDIRRANTFLHAKTTAEGRSEFDEPAPRNASGAAPQSEWVDVPQTPDAKPIKLVLPALKK
jgi:hypothetical protein